MNGKIRKLGILVFATFLFFATLETLTTTPEAASINREESSDVLEVPKTGSVGNTKTASTYETLIEIGFLALTGVGFYAINAVKKNSP
jgi:hypothetical protein